MFKPGYTITNSILNNLLEITDVKSLVLRTPILPRQEAKLRRQAMIRMIHSSTSIEGNILNRYEVEKVLVNEKVDAPKRDIFEVKNYRDALYYISKLVEEKKKITVKIILEIHRLATKNVLEKDKCGHFRKSKVFVVSRRGNKIIKVKYTGPEAKSVPKLVKDLVSWLNKISSAPHPNPLPRGEGVNSPFQKGGGGDSVCPIIAAAFAHSEIAAIHPFADGNGRTARLLATLVLYQRGYDFKKLFALEDYYNQDRPNYYKAIHSGKNYQERLKADLTNWLEYFVGGFKFEMQGVKEAVIPLSLDNKMLKKIGGQVYLDKKQIKIVDFMMAMGMVTSGDVIDILSVKERMAQNYLAELVSLKLLKKAGEGAATHYILNI